MLQNVSFGHWKTLVKLAAVSSTFMLISRMHWNFSVKSVAFIRLGSWEVSPTFLFQLPKGSIECFPWWTLMLIFYFVSKDNLNLKMVGKPPAICPTNWHLAFLLLSALDFLASLYLCSWGEKRERISWLQECQQTSWTWLALRDRPKESCCNSPELPGILSVSPSTGN